MLIRWERHTKEGALGFHGWIREGGQVEPLPWQIGNVDELELDGGTIGMEIAREKRRRRLRIIEVKSSIICSIILT